MELKEGQRVQWDENGDLGTIRWVTNKGSFSVDWDNGQYVEYTSDLYNLITVVA